MVTAAGDGRDGEQVRPTEAGDRLGRGQRAVVGTLCWLLPAGFRQRQRAEWTGDLLAMSAAGAGAAARRRYLFAAAWTLPSLRAHARRPGVDRPHAMVPPAVPVAMLARIIAFGLGGAVVCWLIAIPLRWYLLDMPARLAMPGRPLPFDPKDLWPTEGAFVVLWPLWIVISIGAWVFVVNLALAFWLGITTAVVGATQRAARRAERVMTALLGAVITTLAFLVFANPFPYVHVPHYVYVPHGLAPAILGAIAVLFGIAARRLTRRMRIVIVLAGLGAIGIFASYFTELGAAMLQWHSD